MNIFIYMLIMHRLRSKIMVVSKLVGTGGRERDNSRGGRSIKIIWVSFTSRGIKSMQI
jgi:hypothetical protein